MEHPCKKGFKVVIKGAGEMATGIAHRLFMAHFKNLVMTEIPNPITVRRTVAFSEAVYNKKAEVEGLTAEYAENLSEVFDIWKREHIAVIVDPKWGIIKNLKPDAVVDAIMAKKNIGTRKDEAHIVIGVGPGFCAPSDVHAVIESNRAIILVEQYMQAPPKPIQVYLAPQWVSQKSECCVPPTAGQ